MAVNHVVYGGSTLIDLRSDTVTSAEHIMAGHVGHLANGAIAIGTGGVSRETIVPETTVSVTAGSWAQLTVGVTPSLVAGEYYAYIINGVERVATATEAVGNIYLSDVQFDWGGDSFAFAYNDNGIHFGASAQSGEYTVKVDKFTL